MNKCLLGDIDIFLTDGRIDGELFDKETLLKKDCLWLFEKPGN